MIRPLTKPLAGTGKLERDARKATHKAHEQREMQAAKKRDKVCRFPRCPFTKHLVLDPAHLRHRGMGGNPKGDRTTRDSVITLCRRHHDQFDRGDLEIEVLTPRGTDGPCMFSLRGESGRMEHIASERLIGITEPRR